MVACLLAPALLLPVLPAAAAAPPATASASAPPAVSGAWARATLPGQDSGVAYLTITSPVADRLIAASSPDASAAMLHQTTRAGSMSGMTDMDDLALPAGQAVALAPGGTHVMLMGLRHKLVAGMRLRLDLSFARAGVVHLSVPVAPAGATAPPG